MLSLLLKGASTNLGNVELQAIAEEDGDFTMTILGNDREDRYHQFDFGDISESELDDFIILLQRAKALRRGEPKNPPKKRPVTDHVPQTVPVRPVFKTPPNCKANKDDDAAWPVDSICDACGKNPIKCPYGHQR